MTADIFCKLWLHSFNVCFISSKLQASVVVIKFICFKFFVWVIHTVILSKEVCGLVTIHIYFIKFNIRNDSTLPPKSFNTNLCVYTYKITSVYLKFLHVKSRALTCILASFPVDVFIGFTLRIKIHLRQLVCIRHTFKYPHLTKDKTRH